MRLQNVIHMQLVVDMTLKIFICKELHVKWKRDIRIVFIYTIKNLI